MMFIARVQCDKVYVSFCFSKRSQVLHVFGIIFKGLLFLSVNKSHEKTETIMCRLYKTKFRLSHSIEWESVSKLLTQLVFTLYFVKHTRQCEQMPHGQLDPSIGQNIQVNLLIVMGK